MSKQLQLDVAQLTDVGRKRPHNEDNMAYVVPKDEQALTRKGALFIVADGMGGHAAGEVASEIAVDTVTKVYYEDENEDIPLSLINAIKRANTIIHQRADENTLRSGMGTTCVAAVLCGNVAYIANVGDSRAYIVRQSQLRQISQDHSWVEEQVRAGLLTREQARSHAQRNVITRCLGTQTDVEVDVFPELLSDGDTLVLCTDGLSGSIGEEDLYSIIHQFVPQESVYHLVERANENGGPDNITAIVVHVLEVGAEVPSFRYPVPAGSREADADTAILGSLSTSVLSPASRVEDEARWTSSLETKSGPLAGSSNEAPFSSASRSQAHPTRRRLLYLTVALIVLILTLFSGGAYYAVHSLIDASQLSNARSLIDRANAESAHNPVDALQRLAQAQSALLSTQGSFLIGDQASQYDALQGSLRQTLQKTMVAYNERQLITQLPCTITQSAAISGKVQPVSLSIIQDEKGKSYSYVLANDRNLYHLDEGHRLTGPHSFANKVRVLYLAGSGQHLFAVTDQSGLPGNATTYHVRMFSFDQAPTLKEEALAVDSNLMKQGWVPAFLTASGNDVYLVLTSPTPAHQVMILSYDAKNWQKPVQTLSIPIQPDIVSVAAFSNKQLFFLTSDGHIRILPFGDGGSTSQPKDLFVQNPVSPPVENDGTHFRLNTPIATPVPQSPQVATSAISGLTFLSAGSVGGNTHLYLVDNPKRRILDLQFVAAVSVPVPQATPTPSGTPTPSASPTSSNGAGALSQPSLKVLQQFVSTSILTSVGSATVTSDGKGLRLLTQGGSTLTTISSLDKAPSCSIAA